jgi:hypothetical protein
MIVHRAAAADRPKEPPPSRDRTRGWQAGERFETKEAAN